MTKRSGYSIKISAFIEASPTDMPAMQLAISAIDAMCIAMRQNGFQMVTHNSRFMLSKDIPDDPKPEPCYVPTNEGPVMVRVSGAGSTDEMPDIPAGLRRA